MYQVEFVLVEPGVLGIIDNEFEIGRNADIVSHGRTNWVLAFNYSQCWLPWTEIDASDLALRMLISYEQC
jgi:hypothetical protein